MKEKQEDTDFSFETEENFVTEGEVQMGQKSELDVPVETQKSQGEIDLEKKEELKNQRLDNFKKKVSTENWIAFNKKDLAHVVRMLDFQSKNGYDSTTLSFLFDATKEKGYVEVLYTSGLAVSRSRIKVLDQSGEIPLFVISINSFVKAFQACDSVVALYEQDDDLYTSVFGGSYFLDTFSRDDGNHLKARLMESIVGEVKENYVLNRSWINLLAFLLPLVKQGKRVEEKAIYMEEDATHIFAGPVSGKFEGFGKSLTLQIYDIETLTTYLADADQSVSLEELTTGEDVMLKFSIPDREIFIYPKTMTLGEAERYVGVDVQDKYTVADIGKLNRVLDFLSTVENTKSVVTLFTDSEGMKVQCLMNGREDRNSEFLLDGELNGRGLTKTDFDLGEMRSFLKVFQGETTFKTSKNQLYVLNQFGELLVRATH